MGGGDYRAQRTHRTCVLRVNQNFELISSRMKMSGVHKALGVDAEQVTEMLTRIGELGLHFRRLLILSGSQNLGPETLIEAQHQTFDLALRLTDDALSPLEMLNIGGGLGIPYFTGEQLLDLDPIGEHLAGCLPGVRERLPEVELLVELERFLVGEAGVCFVEMLDRKVSRGQTFLITDGGLHHHPAALDNFGQVIRKNYQVVVGNRVQGAERDPVSVVGPPCTPLDVLTQQMAPGDQRSGPARQDSRHHANDTFNCNR